MGKRLANDFGFVPDTQDEVATDPAPKKDDFGFVPDEPVKKKDESSLASSSDSTEPGKPSKESSEKNIVSLTPEQQRDIGSIKLKREGEPVRPVIQFSTDKNGTEKISNPFITLKRKGEDVLLYQMPASLVAGGSAVLGGTEGLVKYPERQLQKTGALPVNYQEKSQKEIEQINLKINSAFTKATQSNSQGKLTEANKQSLLNSISEASDRKNFLNKFSPSYDKSKIKEWQKGLMNWAVDRSEKGGKISEDLINRLSDINDPIDALNWVVGSAAESGVQIPAALLTFGGSSVGQEIGSIYMDSVIKIARDNGITPQQVIERGMDDSASALTFGTMAGILDFIGAKGAVKITGIAKSDLAKSLRQRSLQYFKEFGKGAIPESGTELSQTVLEQASVISSAGGEIDYEDLGESTLKGFVGGGGARVVTAASKKPKLSTEEVVKDQTKNLKDSDIAAIENAADVIDARVNQEPTDIPATKQEQDAIQEPSATEVPPGAQGGIGAEGGERGGVEPIQQGESPVGESIQKEEEIVRTDQVTQQIDETTEQQPSDPSQEQVPAEEVSSAASGVQGIQGVGPAGPESVGGSLGPESIATTQEETGQELAPENTTSELVIPENDENLKLSGIKKALVSEEKIGATPIERRSTEEMLTKAKGQVDSGEINPRAIVDEIAGGKPRALQPDEVAGLVYYKTQLDNKSDILNDQLLKAIESGNKENEYALRTQLTALEKDIDAYHTMSIHTAYEQSLAFRLRQMLLDNEYNLQSQIIKYKARNRGFIPAKVEERFRDLDRQLKEANEKIRAIEEKKASKQADQSLKNIKREIEKEKKERIKLITDKKKVEINDFFESLKIKDVGGTANDVIRVLGSATWNGSLEIMKKAVLAGADVTNAIQAGIDYIKENYKGSEFNPDEFKSLVQPGIEKVIPKQKAPEIKEGKLIIPNKLIKDLVSSGIDDINDLTTRIHDIVKAENPEITIREVRDAITKYGETKNLSKDDIDTKIREIKRVGKLVSGLEDVQNKIRPLRSGLQRDTLTDRERRMQRELKEKMKDLPVDDAELDKAWKTALDSVKSRLRNQIADLENQIKTGEKSPAKKGVKYDQEAQALKDQRDKLKQVIEDIEGKPTISDEQKVRMAINAVEKSIANYERRVKEKDLSPKKISFTPETPELKKLREKRNQIKAVFKQMEADAGIVEKKKLANYKKAIAKGIERYQKRIADKDFETVKKEPLELDEEAKKLVIERNKIKEQFDLEQEKNRLANKPMNEWIWDKFIDIWNLPKSLLASVDMSAPFRQGAILSIANPKTGGKSFVEMFRQAFSEKRATTWLHALKESPEYALMKQSKLYLAEPNVKLNAKEEQFLSNFASKIPLLGSLVRGSERAYTGYLNKLRVDIFVNGVDRLGESGITPKSNPEAFTAWADFINNATGRGNLGALENAAPILNGLFFSPRYVASRFNLLNPATYAKMPVEVRKMALKNMISYIGFGALFLALANAAGAETEEDPRSTDFGKIKIGNTRYDIWAGFQQQVRFFAQFITGQRKSAQGNVSNLDGKQFPFETRGDLGLKFIRSKLSPTAGTLVNFMEGRNIIGEEVTIQGEAIKSVVPLYLQDMKQMYEKEGATGLLTTAVPAFFGIGVQNYEKKKK